MVLALSSQQSQQIESLQQLNKQYHSQPTISSKLPSSQTPWRKWRYPARHPARHPAGPHRQSWRRLRQSRHALPTTHQAPWLQGPPRRSATLFRKMQRNPRRNLTMECLLQVESLPQGSSSPRTQAKPTLLPLPTALRTKNQTTMIRQATENQRKRNQSWIAPSYARESGV